MPAGPFSYTLLDPGLLPDATGFRTVGVSQINDAGEVLGSVSASPGGSRPFLYSDGSFTDLDVPGAASTTATGLDNAGEVIGRYTDSAGSHSFTYADGAFTEVAAPGAAFTTVLQVTGGGLLLAEYFDSAGLHPAIDDGGAFTPLAVPGAASTVVRANTAPSGGGTLPVLNDAGQAVGSYTDDAGSHAFLYDGNGNYTTLAVPGASNTTATEINAAGQVLGTYTTAGGTGTRTFLYSDGAYATVAVPGATNTTGLQLNDAGQVAGSYNDSAGTHVFLDTDGTYATVNSPLGGSANFVQLDNAGDVLASSYPAGFSGPQPFIYSGGVSTGAGVPGASNTTATRINDLGQLVGTFSDGVTTHAFLATPGDAGAAQAGMAGDPAAAGDAAAALLSPVDGSAAPVPSIAVTDPGLLPA